VLLQYLILNKSKDEHTRTRQKDVGVQQTWDFIKNHWEADDPKMIISVTGGKLPFFMNQRLLKSFQSGLMKAAIATGEQSRHHNLTTSTILLFHHKAPSTLATVAENDDYSRRFRKFVESS